MKNLHKLLKGEHVLGLTNLWFEKDRPCAACQAGKQVGNTHHNKNVMTTSRPLELLHMDLFGPVAYLSIGGSKYGLVIVDDFSRFTWVFFLQDKSETQGTLKRFLRSAQNEFELKVKKIRSDNESEFNNLQVEEYLEEEGIKHEFSAPYTPHQNGVVERKNRTLIDMARTMLWRIQDARAVLVGSCEHSLPRHKPGLPSSPPQEDLGRRGLARSGLGVGHAGRAQQLQTK
jgi:transposase InsO family protein